MLCEVEESETKSHSEASLINLPATPYYSRSVLTFSTFAAKAASHNASHTASQKFDGTSPVHPNKQLQIRWRKSDSTREIDLHGNPRPLNDASIQGLVSMDAGVER